MFHRASLWTPETHRSHDPTLAEHSPHQKISFELHKKSFSREDIRRSIVLVNTGGELWNKAVQQRRQHEAGS